MVDLVVAGSAQGHKVLSGMGAAFGNRDLVMHLCRRNQFSFFLTLLTQRMLADVSVTDAFPGTAILFVDIRRSFIPVVLSACSHRMILTILTIGQLWTAGV